MTTAFETIPCPFQHMASLFCFTKSYLFCSRNTAQHKTHLCVDSTVDPLLVISAMQELKQWLEQEHQHKLEVKETLLMTIATLGLHTSSPSAQLLVLAVLVGRLDDVDPGIRSYSAELLLGKCQ